MTKFIEEKINQVMNAMDCAFKVGSEEIYLPPGALGFMIEAPTKDPHQPKEKEACKILANAGSRVILLDETGSKDKTCYGIICLLAIGDCNTYSFELRTPEGGTMGNFNNALRHAGDKKADVAVVDLRYSSHTQQTIMDGIKMYYLKNSHMFKYVVLIHSDAFVRVLSITSNLWPNQSCTHTA